MTPYSHVHNTHGSYNNRVDGRNEMIVAINILCWFLFSISAGLRVQNQQQRQQNHHRPLNQS